MEKALPTVSSFLDYFNNLITYVEASCVSTDKLENEIMEAINQNNSIYVIGNGGSASTGEHFATDMSFIRQTQDLSKITIEALTANSALISALSNDIGFDQIFSHQLKRKAKSKDLLLIISASGNSKNLVVAAKQAKSIGMRLVALLGFDGGEISEMVDEAIVVRSPIGAYGPVEDLHLAICHFIAQKIRARICDVSQ
jgi:phosphoheptose isomerase